MLTLEIVVKNQNEISKSETKKKQNQKPKTGLKTLVQHQIRSRNKKPNSQFQLSRNNNPTTYIRIKISIRSLNFERVSKRTLDMIVISYKTRINKKEHILTGMGKNR